VTNSTDFLILLLAVAALVAAIFGSRLLVGWLRLLRLRFSPAATRPAERTGMPRAVAAILDSMAPRLAALGFRYEETVQRDSELRIAATEPTWLDVHLHPASGSRATVQPAEAPEPGAPATVVFLANMADRLLITENRRQHLLLPMPALCEVADANAASLAEHWAYHCRRLESLRQPVIADREALRRRRDELLPAIYEHARTLGAMRRDGDAWRFTARGAWRHLRRLMAGMRRIGRLPPIADASAPEVDLLADRQAWQTQEAALAATAMTPRGKLFWFLVSGAIGAAAFAYLTSWQFLPLFLGVLLFHEFGHALAMRAFGYRNLSVLVLPFLGAVAIGRKDDAGPWQKLAVLLAGPVPGLVVAVVALRIAAADPAQHELLTMLGTLALFINLFNLLPVTPLDGGQIVDTFLFARRPRLRFGFMAASALALAGIGWWLDSKPLAALGVILMFTLPLARRRLRLLSQVPRSADDAVGAILHSLHRTAERRPNFPARMQLLRTLLPLVRGRTPAWYEGLGGLAAYVAAAALPLVLLWDTGLPQQTASQLAHARDRNDEPPKPPDWQAQLARAEDPESRWQVLWAAGRWFEEYEQEDEARERYQAALTVASAMPPGSTRELHLLDARIALARLDEPDAARRSYDALLAQLRALPAAERWRLADVLDAIAMLDYRGSPQARGARLREAVAAREAAQQPDRFALIRDRIELARVVDAAGDGGAAEALLRRNFAERSPDGKQTIVWLVEPAAWFFIAHDRPAEAEALLTGLPAGNPGVRQALAWSRLAQGDAPGARAILAAEYARLGKQRWQDWLRIGVALDLVAASADDPAEQTRWLGEVAAIRESMGRQFRGLRNSIRGEATTVAWEQRRGQARLAILDRLPGAGQDAREDADNSCKGRERK